MEEKKLPVVEKIFENEMIYETEYFRVEQDFELAVPGFYIVVPKRKVRSLVEFNEQESVDYIRVIKKVREAMLDVLGIENVSFFQDERSSWGFHLWMLPYYDWMKKISKRGPMVLASIWEYVQENRNTEENIQETRDVAQRIRDYFSKN